MHLEKLWLTDFRNYAQQSVALAPGITAVVGPNGQGKTNLLEAVAWLATLGSFRAASPEALVRAGQPAAFVRAEGERGGRPVLIEAEISPGRSRVQVNRQRLARSRDLLGVLRVTVFTPDDLALVKEGPAGRREFLDAALVALDPRADGVIRQVERVLRQRNALLRQVGGRLDADAALTLDVWDTKLAAAGEQLGAARAGLVERLRPEVVRAYRDLAAAEVPVELDYVTAWARGGLAEALASARSADVARGVSQIGPHRDELAIGLAGMAARTHASQGEQRCLALALRLASHRLVTETVGEAPLLLLDDVFSELDASRSAALVAHLPAGQALLTTATRLPPGSRPERVYRVEDGRLSEPAGPPAPEEDGPPAGVDGDQAEAGAGRARGTDTGGDG